ncbi:MAG: hypothetical protein QNJ85_09350 [Gammaproteobacteria bacterium]|nr:hypothetical protein [Gammaproteobacteria bacterium]
MDQLPEIIHIDGVLHVLYTTPLLPWLEQQQPVPEFDRRAPNCERGYVGTWQLRERQLYLTGIHAWRDGRYTGVAALFDNRREVAADWFTGPLVVEPSANEIADGTLPKVRTLLIESGRLTRSLDQPAAKPVGS